MNAGSLCTRHVTIATGSMFFLIFLKKRHKIVEFFALLTTGLSSYKMGKVGRGRGSTSKVHERGGGGGH